MGSLLLDTHVWLWLAFGTPEKIKASTRRALEKASADEPLLISIISVWEVALLAAKRRVSLPMSVETWVERALDRSDIRLIDLKHPRIVIDSCHLPGNFHSDPADRLLVATARSENAVLVTHDKKILGYGAAGHVKVLPT
ncbi:MAG: type II toxin-antitoxin system VapC family toxin [Gammaproteobacteria bacterium]